MAELPSERIQTLLKSIIEQVDVEDRAVRERQIRQWRKLKYYWENFQRVWYSEVAHDWRTWDIETANDSNNDDGYYDKQVNVFRAYLESIIAALSITIPKVVCIPDDADNTLDLETAKAGDRIAELIQKHNDVSLFWLRALYIYCTEGLVFAYNYTKESEKYGTYEEKEYKDETEFAYICPNCQANLGDVLYSENIQDEYAPDDEDILVQDIVQNQGIICPECASQLDPNMQASPFIVTKIVGVTHKPKSRQCIEVYGGLYCKVPNYAMQQKDCPYLVLSREVHFTEVIAKYNHLKDKIKGGAMSVEPYESWGRLNPQYAGDYPINVISVRDYWLRPCLFEQLQDEEDVALLKKEYPNGVKVCMADDEFASACNEGLDDCWTLSRNPLSDHLHHDPLGMLLVSVQDITNDLISLILQTIEHGVSQTYADPMVVNFNQYKQHQVSPGSIVPAKPKSGKTLSESFYESKTATLSNEVMPFAQSVQEMGQLVSGALPSLFGGGPTAGSKTAAEYSMSRAQAQQRLQTPWKMLTIWWKEIHGKVIPSFIKDLVEDERYVKKDKSGNFINVFIRKAELQGKIGEIELDISDQLPNTWEEKKDIIMKMMEAGNPIVLEALMSIENLPFVKQALGMEELVMPGEEDRNKQYEEIKILLNTEPISMPPDEMTVMASIEATGQPPPDEQLPSVEVDPDLDNHEIESDICRRWLISSAGRLAKIENPEGYKNVLLHMKMHQMVLQSQMMEQMLMQSQMQPNQGNPKDGAAKGKPDNAGLVAPKGGKPNGSGQPTVTVQ